MSIFDNGSKNGGLMDMIRCDEPDYLIWKWHPAGAVAGQNKRENAIRWGSSLRVKQGEVVAFLYEQNQGTEPDYIEGPFDKIIETNNFPILSSLIGLAYNGDTPFQAEVYFINTAGIVQVKFAVPFFDIYDSRFPELGVPVAVRGTISFCISDYRQFVRLHKLANLDVKDLQTKIRDLVCKYVKGIVINAPDDHQIPVIQIERRILEISELLEEGLRVRLQNDFGVSLTAVDISDIELDKTSEGYRQLKSVTQDINISKIQAQGAADIKTIHDAQQINMENARETARIQREEAQYAQHLQTQSSNIAVHQINQQAAVGIAGAEGVGKMGAGAGMSTGGEGFNPAAMMAGMAIGGTIGQNLAGTMNNMMSGVNQPVQQQSVTPPQIPSEEFYVAIGGKPSGPHSLDSLKKMATSGEIKKEMLFWKEGMAEWKKGKEIDSIKSLFVEMPPIPTDES